MRGMIRTQRPLSTATWSWPPSSPASAGRADCTVSREPVGSESLASTSTMTEAVPRMVTWSGEAVGRLGPDSATSMRMLPCANLAAPNFAVYSRKYVRASAAVTSTSPDFRSVSTWSPSTACSRDASSSVARGFSGSAPGMSLLSGRTRIGRPTSPRTASGSVMGASPLVASKASTLTFIVACCGSDRPSETS